MVRVQEGPATLQRLLAKLLAGTEPRVHDLNVLPRLVASQADELLRQVPDLHLLAQVQDEDLARPGEDGRLDQEAHGLRRRHEVAGCLGVGEKHRAAPLDLA